MFHLLFLGAILLTNLVNAKTNITCYECKACKSTPTKISIGNNLCFHIQMNCLAADIHIVDLEGDRMHSNYSLANCGQTLVYSSACTVINHCCYTDKCNTFEIPFPSSPQTTSSSSSLVIFKRIVISSSLLLMYFRFTS